MRKLFMGLDVRIWLPGETEPVVAGQVLFGGTKTSFVYDRKYLKNKAAFSIYAKDLPLGRDEIRIGNPYTLCPSLRDALPDLWGRRAIAASYRHGDFDPHRGDEIDEVIITMFTGSDRIGALDLRFPCKPKKKFVMEDERPPIEDLMVLADLIEANKEVEGNYLWDMLPHCALVGGARPKALFTDAAGRKFIAKFTAKGDTYPVVQGEYIAMRLGALAGLDVAPVYIEHVAGRPVLLVERFDRVAHPGGGWTRKSIVSALTWTQEAELSAHHISYPQLAGIITDTFENAPAALEEFFTRLIFNILVGNTDDHARNHAAFWNGHSHRLTPAYDIAPQRRISRQAGQAMILSNRSRAAQLANAAAIAPIFGVDQPQFTRIVDRLVGTITDRWSDVCDEASLSRKECAAFAGKQFLNAFAFEGHGQTPRLT